MKRRGKPALRVLIVDDHPMVRDGIRSMLGETSVKIVAEAGTGGEAVRRASTVRTDLILLDMKLPDMDGLLVLRRLKQVTPQASVLIITMHDDPVLVCRAIEAGAAGYLLKGVSRTELLASIRAVRNGESVLSPSLLRAVLSVRPQLAAPEQAGISTSEGLSPVELNVLRLLATGMTNREIAVHLRWSIATVKKYVQRIFEKLEVSDRTQAAVAAVRYGLLH